MFQANFKSEDQVHSYETHDLVWKEKCGQRRWDKA